MVQYFDFVDFISQSIDTIISKNIKIITNAGGVNPYRCAEEIKKRTTDKIKIAIQINGKRRDEILIAKDAGDNVIREMAIKTKKITRHIGDREIKKVIVIAGKVVNIVL